jgi:hypothetical protein
MKWQEDGLSSHSRQVLQECLENIRKAVKEYRYWGAAGLNQSLTEYTGTLFTDQILQADLRSNADRNGNVGKLAMKVGAGLLWLMTILNGAHDFRQNYLPAIESLILPGTSGATKKTDEPAKDHLPINSEIPLPARSENIKEDHKKRG